MSGFATIHIAECVMCGRPVDTREEAEGGDAQGAQLSTGDWVCSAQCWYAAVEEKEGLDENG
jgi:hypothetical protein